MATQTSTTKKAKGKFFRSVANELKKVNWPNRKELGSYVTVVIAMCVISATVLGVFDFAFKILINQVIEFL